MGLQENHMSEQKRNDSQFSFPPSPAETARTAMPGIDESQPRPTLEMNKAIALLESSEESGGDPYNAVGRRATGPRAA